MTLPYTVVVVGGGGGSLAVALEKLGAAARFITPEELAENEATADLVLSIKAERPKELREPSPAPFRPWLKAKKGRSKSV